MRSVLKRRFRFSLRTLFVAMTVLCCWLGYNLDWIRRRHDALEHLHIGSYAAANRAVWNNVPLDLSMTAMRPRDVKAPWSLRLFGEPGMSSVFVYGPDHATFAENLQRLFPEAEVSCSESPPPTALERMLSARKQFDSMTWRLLEQSAQETSEPEVAAPAVE